MTIDKLARTSQREFTEVHGEFADVRKEMREGFSKVDEDMSILRRDMEAGFSGMSEGMKTILEKLNSLQADVVETHDLRSRVERLEKKVGLSR